MRTNSRNLSIFSNTLLAALACLSLSTSAQAVGLEVSAGQYRLTDEPAKTSMGFGEPNTPFSVSGNLVQTVGKFRFGAGVRTGSVNYTSEYSDDVKATIEGFTAAMSELIEARDSLEIQAADYDNPDRADIALQVEALDSQIKDIKEQSVNLTLPYHAADRHTGVTALAMYSLTDTVAVGAEVFANTDTDEVIPSLKAEASSKHGNMTVGTTVNAGDDWVGFGTVVRF